MQLSNLFALVQVLTILNLSDINANNDLNKSTIQLNMCEVVFFYHLYMIWPIWAIFRSQTLKGIALKMH
jgi:hypothetical protein